MIFQTRSAGEVRFDWDGAELSVWTCSQPAERIGEFSFKLFEDDSGALYALVTGMHLEGPDGTERYKRQGIGRKILSYVSELEGAVPVFTYPDGNRRDDGSHLTGDGPAFASNMIEEGLACWF